MSFPVRPSMMEELMQGQQAAYDSQHMGPPSYGRPVFDTDEASMDIPTLSSNPTVQPTYGRVAFPGVESPIDLPKSVQLNQGDKEQHDNHVSATHIDISLHDIPQSDYVLNDRTQSDHIQNDRLQIDCDQSSSQNTDNLPLESSPPNEAKLIHQLVTSSLFQLCHNSLTFKEHICISGDLKFSVDSDSEMHDIHIDENICAVKKQEEDDVDDEGREPQMQTPLDDPDNPDDMRSTRSGNTRPPKKMKNNKPFGCAICGKSFLNKSYVENHIASHKRDVYITSNIVYHQGKTPFKCDICGEGFDEIKRWKIHVRTHPKPRKPGKPRAKRIKTYLEASDGYEDNDLVNFENEIENVENDEVEDEDTKDDGDYPMSLRHKRRGGRSHVREKRKPLVKPFGCGVCKKSFLTKSYLKKHIVKHKGDLDVASNIIYFKGENPYECDICGVQFDDQNKRKNHMRTHTGEKPYLCTLCGKGFSTTSILKQHRLIHDPNAIKKYKCSLCHKAFLKSSTLSHHMKVHGEKEHLCTTCGKWFSRKRYLMIHTRIHTGEKPYMCTTCGRAFIAASTLATHQRTHTGEKPYACPVCDARFPYKDGLDRHMTSHTGQKMEPRKKKAARERHPIRSDQIQGITEVPIFREQSINCHSMDSFQSPEHNSQHSFQPLTHPLAPPHQPPQSLHNQTSPPLEFAPHHPQYQPQPHSILGEAHPIFPERHENIPPYVHQFPGPPKWGSFLYHM